MNHEQWLEFGRMLIQEFGTRKNRRVSPIWEQLPQNNAPSNDDDDDDETDDQSDAAGGGV